MSDQSPAAEDANDMDDREDEGVVLQPVLLALRNRVAEVLTARALFPVMATYLLSYTALIFTGLMRGMRRAGAENSPVHKSAFLD